MGGLNSFVTPPRPLRYDWEHPRRLVVPLSTGASGLCGSWFGGAAVAAPMSCPTGQEFVGVDFVTRTLICQPRVTLNCDYGQAISGTNPDGTPVCTNMPGGGGQFQVHICSPSGSYRGADAAPLPRGGCRTANSVTGSCSCPDGFKAVRINDFDSPASGSPTGCPQNFYENRGMIQYSCN